jgi:hypothetical protein
MLITLGYNDKYTFSINDSEIVATNDNINLEIN